MPPTMTPEELAERLQGMQPRLAAILQRKAIAFALMLEGDAKANATERPRSRTGLLRRSIAGTVQDTDTGITVQLSAGGRHGGRDVIYARVQELGDRIVPKTAKWLAIPDDSVKTAAGVARYPSPRNYPGKLWFHVIEENRRAVLLERIGGRNVGRWWLRKEANIKPKRYLARSVDANVPKLPTLLSDALRLSLAPSMQGA